VSARTDLATYLTTALPDFNVLPFYRDVDGVEGITVMVHASAITHDAKFVWTADVQVYVLSGHQDPQRAEDALDEALDRVIGVLATYPPTNDASAERAVVNGSSVQAWTVNLKIPYFTNKD
jgi:hypothetical protein